MNAAERGSAPVPTLVAAILLALAGSTLACGLTTRLQVGIGMDIATAPVESETYVAVERRKLFYQQAGDPRNPPLVLLHGAGATPADLPVVLRGFAHRGFFAVAPEHPGMGRSEHLASYRPDFFKRYAVAYYDLLREKDIREPILVAHSFGGGPANALAEFRPEGDSWRSEARLEPYRPKALVLVDAMMGQPPRRAGLSAVYGWFLRNLEHPLRLPWTGLLHSLTSFFTGTPSEWYRNDVDGDVALAEAMGELFGRFAHGHAPVEIDYRHFVLGSGRQRPLILIWGERDGTRWLDYGEWGARLTAIDDARALSDRVLREVADELSRTSPAAGCSAIEAARKLVRFSVVENAGHAGMFTHTHMDTYLDAIVSHLRAAGIASGPCPTAVPAARVRPRQRVS